MLTWPARENLRDATTVNVVMGRRNGLGPPARARAAFLPLATMGKTPNFKLQTPGKLKFQVPGLLTSPGLRLLDNPG